MNWQIEELQLELAQAQKASASPTKGGGAGSVVTLMLVAGAACPCSRDMLPGGERGEQEGERGGGLGVVFGRRYRRES